MPPQADNSVDFVQCKESFHHFPRPMVSFYEMMRVARYGVLCASPSASSPSTRPNRLQCLSYFSIPIVIPF